MTSKERMAAAQWERVFRRLTHAGALLWRKKGDFRLWLTVILLVSLVGVGCGSRKLVVGERSVGTVRIFSDPPGAAVEFDGSPRGETPVLEPLVLKGVPYGWHTIRVGISGRVPRVEEVELRSPELEVHIPLGTSAFGRVVIYTQPPGAEVFIDSRYYGETKPMLTIDKIPYGEHSLWVRLEGHREERRSILVERQVERGYRMYLEKN